MESLPQNIPDFQPCQFVLDSDGRILHSDPLCVDKLMLPESIKSGDLLRDHLIEINPQWEICLPQNWQQAKAPLFLPWMQNERTYAAGLRLHLLPYEDRIHLSIIPELAPDFQHASLQEIPRNPSALVQLVLRLRQAESRLDHYLTHFPGVAFSQRPDFSFSFISPGSEELFSMSPDELTRNSSTFLNCIFSADREQFLQDLEKNQQSRETFTLNYRIQRPRDEQACYVMDVRTPKFAPGGLLLGYEGVWLDITRQAIAENRLTRTSWKETLALITSGLVHDFSNIMAGIYSLSELYYSSLDKDHAWNRGMEQIMKNAKQARQLVRRIIDLNREVGGNPDYHNIETLIRDQLDLVKAILPKHTQYHLELTNKELPVYIDDVSFRQLVLNLALNSRDAMPEQGEITIQVEPVNAGDTIFEKTVGGAIKTDKEGLVLYFKDNGSGIPKEYLPHIFEAFFTTKESTKGSGFGLYNAQLFIKKCRGKMDVESKSGNTTFHIYLPLADFTEALSDTHWESEPEKNRPQLAVYCSQDPSNYHLVDRLRAKEWQIGTFTEPKNLLDSFKECAFQPHILLVMLIGKDPNANKLLRQIGKDYPNIKRSLLLIGKQADDLSPSLKAKAELILDDSLMPNEIIEALTELKDKQISTTTA